MSNYDELLAGTTKQEPPKSQFKPATEFDKETWAAQKQAERTEVFALMDGASEAVVRDCKDFQRFLNLQSRFDKYSVGNVLLILAQKSDCTQLRDFDNWKENGVSILKSEKGISILEPGEEYTRDDGTTAISYSVKKVFDISQTNAKPQTAPHVLNERELIKALMSCSSVLITISDKLPNNVGAKYDHESHVISIRQGMDGGSIIRSLTQEIAHAEMDKSDGMYSRNDSSFTAYCVSYMLCKKYGIDVSNYDFNRLPERFNGLVAQEARAELSKIRSVSNALIENINMAVDVKRSEQKKTQPER